MEISLAAETLTHIGSLPITNTLWVSFAISTLLVIVAWRASKNLATIPKGLQFWAESIIEFLYNLILDTTGSEKLTKKYLPFVGTLLLFFLVGNMLTFLPGTDAFFVKAPETTQATEHKTETAPENETATESGPKEEAHENLHLYRTVTTDYNVVLAVTLVSFVMIQLAGIRGNGTLGYIKKFINFSSPINFLVGILELIGEFSRIISLSFRHFGNMFAKKVLVLVILGMVPLLAPVPFSLLGIIVALIQSFVFFLIVVIQITLNSASHSE
ncbi:MAG: FoF1 ATP synthase subunit a [Patescibacteria group bacterium]|jgi:F-type H+-transporting ATPase subunit a